MTKDEFDRLFRSAIEIAAVNAQGQLGQPISREFEIELHGAGHPGDQMSIETAGEELYLGEDTFYAIIDVAIIQVSNQSTTVFVRASDHTPVPFHKTWDPNDKGPFKQLIAQQIKLS